MSRTLALVRRELGGYFASPVAYLLLTALLILSGAVFSNLLERTAQAQLPFDYGGTLSLLLWVLVLTSPLVTMRLVAQENQQGTIETLMTAPVSEAQVVVAKFSAAVVLATCLLLPTCVYPLLVASHGPVDVGAVLCGYAGVVAIVAMVYSIGLFISCLCCNPVSAGVVTFTVSFLLLATRLLSLSLPPDSLWVQLLEVVDLSANASDFVRGILDLGRLVYLLATTVVFLFLAARVLGSRRWR